ncbi:diacylglycerol kinase family protein [Carboxylicivirga linearis]|uniref:Diacylglycerol kinase family protein n=1 Tax=Carboxylicivirga linearis TaxID=1628157 RepID=A0ABS5JUB5_9BACT|nr:diacylglycerol kinase family protein [Carboxylicivirga linearis]MBS2098475.1 diacylglycerol kinase family protein [Carboxylicivirga linearis]
MNYFTSRGKSFLYAFKGIKHLMLGEPNALIHLIAAITAVLFGIYFQISTNEWLWICLAIVLVFICEIINTAIENLGDVITKDYNKSIEKAKDLGAAATFLAALFSIVVALIIFLPKIKAFFYTI